MDERLLRDVGNLCGSLSMYKDNADGVLEDTCEYEDTDCGLMGQTIY